MKRKKEITIIVIWSAIVSFAALLPVMYGHLHAPPGHSFTGLIKSLYPTDVNSYFAWIKQAYDGNILFENKFTTEPHHAWIFNPVFLFIGYAAHLFHIDVIYVWYTVIITSNIILLCVLYHFIVYFFSTLEEDKLESRVTSQEGGTEASQPVLDASLLRIIAFIYVTVASGFGWVVGSADWWMPEMYVFQSMRWPILFSLGTALILSVFLCFIRLVESGALKYAAFAGLLALTLSFVHPYDIFVVVPVGLVFVYGSALRDKKIKQAVSSSIVFVVLLFPGILYNVLVTVFDPVFKEHSRVAMESPPLLSYILGFGISLIFGIWGVMVVVKKAKRRFYFLLYWLLIGFSLLYAPLLFQRRLVMGLNIPLILFATLALGEIMQKLKRQWAAAVICTVIALVSIGSIMFIYYDVRILSHSRFPFFIDNAFRGALEWLDRNANKTDIVLASPDSGNFIPRFAGTRTFIGHWAQTVNAERKMADTKWFYSIDTSEEAIKWFLVQNNINYVLCSRREGDCLTDEWQRKVQSIGAVAVYTNTAVTLFKIKEN
jgi:hypothetical protein